MNEAIELSTEQSKTPSETISRIQRDVKVTGTLIGTKGQESAMFQIEGMPDRQFSINNQLMDGFIIVEINDQHVVLKNQLGDETIRLTVAG